MPIKVESDTPDEIPSISIGLCSAGSSQELLKSNRRISASLKPIGSDIVVYPVSINHVGGKGNIFEQDRKLTFVQLNQIPTSRYSFLQSALDVFVNVHQQSSKESVSEASFKLQQVIYDYAQSAHADATQNQETQVEASLFAAIHSVWQLARVVFFSSPTDPLRSRLMEWLLINHDSGLEKEYEHIVSLISPRDYEGYWPFVYRCILAGHFQAAQYILQSLPTYKYESLETASNTNPVAAITRFLLTMPTPSVSSIKSQNDLMRWRDDVSFTFENGSMTSLDVQENDKAHFSTLFSILLGEETAIVDVSQSWHEALVGLSLFVHASLNESSFSALVETLGQKYTPETLLDKILWSILRADLASLIRHCAELDWWLATHLIDLLDLSGYLNDNSIVAEIYKNDHSLLPLAEWYRMSFADYLLSCPDLWRVSLEYFSHCPNVGKQMLDLVVPRIPLDSTRKVQKVLAFCELHDLQSSRISILKTLGQNALRENRLVEAISWFVEAKDFVRVESIAESLLDTVLKSSDNHSQYGLDIAKSLNPKILESSSRLRFLYEYYKYRDLLETRQYVEAGQRLILLFTSGSTPASFYAVLLQDVIPLLEGPVVVFGQRDTFDLMRCLEQHVTRSQTLHWSVHTTGNTVGSGAGGGHALDAAKLALSRNLARAVVSNKA